jgi:hypothetical protein
MARFLTTRSQWQEISEVGYPDDVEKQFEALQRISKLSEPSERDGGLGEMAPSALIYLLCAFFVALIVIFVLRTRAMARL